MRDGAKSHARHNGDMWTGFRRLNRSHGRSWRICPHRGEPAGREMWDYVGKAWMACDDGMYETNQRSKLYNRLSLKMI